MASLPLIHLMLGNVPNTGKTSCAALLVDYFRYQGKHVRSFDASSRGAGLSAYTALQATRIDMLRRLMTDNTKELGKAFSFSEELRVIDCSSVDFKTMVSFLRDHHMEEHPGWMVHYVVTAGSLKEAQDGLVELAPLMPFPLVLWRAGFWRETTSFDQVLRSLALLKSDTHGHVDIPKSGRDILALCEQHHVLLHEVQTGRLGITKVTASKDLRTELVAQLDSLLGLNTKASEWVHELA